MSQKLVDRLAQLPHVSFRHRSGRPSCFRLDHRGRHRCTGVRAHQRKFVFREGHGFEKPDDILLDTYYAQQAHVRAGDRVKLLNRNWNVAGIVEPGKLAHIFLPISVVQDLDATSGKVAQIYLKLDDPANTNAVIADVEQLLPGYKVYGLEELVSLTSADNVPFLRPLLNVIIGVAVLIGAAVASLSMYMAVQQRTRDIGILKSLGASKLLILKIILMEALFLGLGGSILGIGFSFLSRWLLAELVPASLPQAIVPSWWPIACAIATGAAILGALYPGMLAARQDPIQALAYE